MADAASGWGGVWGFMDGISGVATRLGGIVNTVADGAEDVARGRAAIDNQQKDEQQREIDQALEIAGFERKDNVTQMWVIGAAAVALILILTQR